MTAKILAILMSCICGSAVAQQQGGSSTSPEVAKLQQQIQGGRAKNIIFLLGDGMGDSEITAARNYQVGAAGHLAMDTLPFTGAVTTYALQESDPSKPDYVTDSAAGGTAWATGQKTSNGRISTSALTDKPLKTILELAKEMGYRTGNITTAEITDATPAVLGAHINRRRCQGPSDLRDCPRYKKSAGGPGSIAEQLIDHKIDVLMGGGKQRYEQILDGGSGEGQNAMAWAESQGYKIITTTQELSQVQLEPQQRLLGLFNAGNMSIEWAGDPAIPYPGSGPQRCREFVRPLSEPALFSMMIKAIRLLKTSDPNAPGFFSAGRGRADR